MRVPRLNWPFALLGLSSFLSGTPEATAQAFQDPCARPVVVGPSDVRLQLSLSGPGVFYEGEIVTLRLSLTSSERDKYYADIRSYDRSGRLEDESFCVEPPGRDPLADYFLGGRVGGGITGGPRPLGTEPLTFERDLNEWKALPPGHYRLRVRRNVDRLAAADERGHGTVPVTVWSNPIELEVVPATPEWRAAQLEAALRFLDGGDRDRAERGARMLRFLGSEAATRELVRRYTGEYDQPHGLQLQFGIVGSPHRELAISTLRSALVDPQHPVTAALVELLAQMEVQSDPEQRLRPYDPKDQKGSAAHAQAWRAAYEKAVRSHQAVAAGALERKSPEARARSFELLLQTLGGGPTNRAEAARQVLAMWDSLQPRQQKDLLEGRWKAIAGPGLLPLLRRLVDSPPPARRVPGAFERELALRRLYELSPEEGRERILREIRVGSRDIGPRLLGSLSDKELPEVEEVILQRIEASRPTNVDWFLVEHYASPRALPRVRTVYERARGFWACQPQSAMLQYFLHVDPRYGAAEVETALASRVRTGCYRTLLGDLHEAVRLPAVERVATDALDDPDPWVTMVAARALERYGSPKAEKALWRRMERFHEEWKGRANLLRLPFGVDRELTYQSGAESALAHAIAWGQSWFCGVERLRSLRELVSPGLKTDVDQWITEVERAALVLSVSWWERTGFSFHLGSFEGSELSALKEKLGQLPAGAQITLFARTQDGKEHRSEIEEIESAVRAAGLELVRR